MEEIKCRNKKCYIYDAVQWLSLPKESREMIVRLIKHLKEQHDNKSLNQTDAG